MPDRHDEPTGVRLDEASLRLVIDEHVATVAPRLKRFWTYYRNPSTPAGMGAFLDANATAAWSARPYRQAQEVGLPPRITGPRLNTLDDRAGSRREVVIENDIAWRIHSMVDFMFGKPVLIRSTARDEAQRTRIERFLDAAWERSGGIALLQDMALLGHVYGHVDLLLRIDEPIADAAALPDPDDRLDAALESIRIEVVEPTRGIPILDPADFRKLDAYVIHCEREGGWSSGFGGPSPSDADPSRGRPEWFGRRWLSRSPGSRRPARSAITEVITSSGSRVYQDGRPIARDDNRFGGLLPVVHVQNVSQPFRYEGLGEVEPLIPLQDELNTRLSDRASRVTLQSFKMYLAKGIDGFDKVPVGPGQIWSTDNPDAQVTAFGGDAESPSEESHIQEVREALDKASGVPPLASGVVRAKIGNLTSANALRITMMGILSKTARKRVTYGRGLTEISRLILTALDAARVLETDPRDRGVKLDWPDPLPVDIRDEAAAARVKSELGVPEDRLLAELGYTGEDPGVT